MDLRHDGGEGAPCLTVRLLGGFDLDSADGLPAIDSQRLQSLLAHLVLRRGEKLSRERLAYLFWPDSEEAQARTNLRKAIHHLRNALPEPNSYLKSESSTVSWRVDAPARLDFAEFEELSADSRRASGPGDERRSLEAAIELYRGDLLPECYDNWIVPERERFRGEFLGALERLAELVEDEGDYRGAIPFAKRLVEDDPLNEGACGRLMRLHALSGDRAAALRVYHALATSLARDTGVEPGPETTAAYERLLEAGDVEPSPRPRDGLPMMVGRAEQLQALRAAWREALGGEARLVAITGDAGIGKSRLAEEFLGWVASQGYETASSRCYAAAGGLAYAPIVEFLRSTPIAARLRQLDDTWLVELARLVPELLEERPELSRPSPLTADWQRARLLDTASRGLLGSGSPLLLVIDDLQWCDTETIDWLRYLLASRPDAPLLVVTTARSEELQAEHPAQELLLQARGSGHAVELGLGPLDVAETEALARSASGRDLGEAGTAAIFRETEGNPLFVVEWSRAGLAAETAKVPAKVQSVIEARLGQLSPDGQELAGLAAAVGRAFSFALISRASSRSEEQLADSMDELTSRGIIRELGDDAYDFSHDKLRQAAYGRIGSPRRRMMHRRVAQALERGTADLDAVAGELAAHLEQAGWAERAAAFYAQAAEVAHRVYSNERAIGLFEKALALLAAEPAAEARDAQELALRTALGAPLVSIEGYGAPRVHDNYRRSAELCERLGTPPEPPVLRGLALVSITRGELLRARELGEQLLERGEREDEVMVRVEGNYVLGVTSFWLGEFAVARRQLERAIAEYRPGDAMTYLAMYSQDPRIVCLSRLAYVLHYLGESEQAEERARDAIRHAEELEHPFSLAYALNFTAWLAIDMGEHELARERAERMAAVADDQQLGFIQPMGTILRGWFLAREGQTDEAVALIGEGLDAYARSGWTLYRPYALALLARVCIDAGRTDDARAAITEALDLSNRTGQRSGEAELRLLEGELLRVEGGGDPGACFRAARELGERQGAVLVAERARALEQPART